MKKKSKSNIIRLVLLACLATFVACGDDNEDTNVVVNPDGPQREEEEEEEEEEQQQQQQDGPVSTRPSVIINNNVDNNVTVNTTRTNVENDVFLFFWRCLNAPREVVHRKYIHASVRCPTLRDDTNGDKIIDEVEVQQVAGPPVITMEEEVGDNFSIDDRIPMRRIREFVRPGEDFAIIIYGANPTYQLPPTCSSVSGGPIHQTIPILCKIVRTPRASSETTGGTTGTTTTGSTDE